MLKVNVGLSRKLSENYNSHGFSVNLEGELCVDLQDTAAVVEKIQEFYDLSEEALLRQIERYQSDSAIASHDETPVAPPVEPPTPEPVTRTTPKNRLTNGEPATNKQIQFLLTLGKRQGLTKPRLEKHIAEVLGETVGVYDLTKRDAGRVLDSLTDKPAKSNGRS